MSNWNPWHGCKKLSPGCKNCYVYRQDLKFSKDSSIITKNSDFDLPIRRNKDGNYKLKAGQPVYTCFTSDFFLDDADEWRLPAWRMMKERRDLDFFIITKRIDRFYIGLPEDWGKGYENVSIACTVENQEMVDYRLPIFLKLPIKHKSLACSPLLGSLNLLPYLNNSIEMVAVGGESGTYARVCNFLDVLDIRRQCIEKGISFYFHQTGARLKKGEKVYKIRRKYQHSQARRAGIDFIIAK